MKILIIDNNIMKESFGAKNLVRQTLDAARGIASKSQGPLTIEVRRAPSPTDDLPPLSRLHEFDRLILSGSMTAAQENFPWVSKLESFVKAFVHKKVPVLGVCYGHQILARVLGGQDHVGKAKEPEFGWTYIRKSGESPLFKGLPAEFVSFSSHFDEVTKLPKGCKKLAESDWCGIQAFELEGYPVFGIQFHPERNCEEGEDLLKRRKKAGTPKKLLFPGKGPKVYKKEIGDTIFSNFLGIKP